MKGKLYGVGVGPGDPELITLKAVRIIDECDIIAVPGKNPTESIALSIAEKAITDITNKEILYLTTPMTRDREELENIYIRNSEHIEKALDMGKSVVFLTLGDPTVYSTYMYMHKKIIADGYEAKIVSGVTSFCASAAAAGVSLAEHSDKLHIVPASYDMEEALSESGNIVFMKAGTKLSELKEELRHDYRKAVMVEYCGMENEKIYTDINDFPDESYLATVLLYQ